MNAQQRLVELLAEGVDEEIHDRTLSAFHPDPERSFRPLRYVRGKALSGSGFQHPNKDQERPDVRVGDYTYALIRLTTEWTNPRPLTNSHFTDRIAILRRATPNRPAALYDVFNTDYSGIEHLPPFLRHYAHGLTRNREFRYVRYQHLNNIARAFAVVLRRTWNPEHLVRTFERPWWLYFASHRGPSPQSIAEKDEQLSLNIKKEILRPIGRFLVKIKSGHVHQSAWSLPCPQRHSGRSRGATRTELPLPAWPDAMEGSKVESQGVPQRKISLTQEPLIEAIPQYESAK